MKTSGVLLIAAIALGIPLGLMAAEEEGILPANKPAGVGEITIPESPADKRKPSKADLASLEAGAQFVSPEAKKSWEQFRKLPQQKQDAFLLLLWEGTDFFQKNRIREAVEKLNDAEIIWADHPVLINGKVALYMHARDFDRAVQYLAKGMALYPESWQMRFNMAEIDFVRKDFKKAEEGFQTLLAKEQRLSPSDRRFVDYKVILCQMKQGRMDEAKQRLDKYDTFDESPIYFYGMAAWHSQKGEPAEAQQWIHDAHRVFDAAKLYVYEDSLKELGWVFAP